MISKNRVSFCLLNAVQEGEAFSPMSLTVGMSEAEGVLGEQEDQEGLVYLCVWVHKMAAQTFILRLSPSPPCNSTFSFPSLVPVLWTVAFKHYQHLKTYLGGNPSQASVKQPDISKTLSSCRQWLCARLLRGGMGEFFCGLWGKGQGKEGQRRT